MEIAAGCIDKFRVHHQRAHILLRSDSAQDSIVVVEERDTVGRQIQPYIGVAAEYVVVHGNGTCAAQRQAAGAALSRGGVAINCILVDLGRSTAVQGTRAAALVCTVAGDEVIPEKGGLSSAPAV